MINVVDAASPRAESERAAVRTVLAELGCQDKPTFVLLNKIDAAADDALIQILAGGEEVAVAILARTGQGLDALVERVAELLVGRDLEATLRVSVADGKALAFLDRQAEVLDRRYDDHTVEIRVRIAASSLDKLVSLGTTTHVIHSEPVAMQS